MPVITADLVVRHDLYAKQNVSALDASFKNVLATFQPNQRIGNIYSYIQDSTGNIYWMVYLSQADYNNQNAVYIKHDASALTVPDLPTIMQQIEDEKKAAEIAKDGVIQYYIKKYLPYIVGAVVISIALPSIAKSLKK